MVDSVASGIESGADGTDPFDLDDDDEEEGRLKRIIKEKIAYGCNVLCIWDCARYTKHIPNLDGF